MNEFEIKVLKEDLKPVKLIDVYDISKEYNIKEYDEVFFEKVFEFEYKAEIYHAYHGDIYSMSETEISKAKSEIQSEIKVMEQIFYKETKNIIDITELTEVIANQIELLSVRKEEPMGCGYLDRLYDKVEEKVKQGRQEGKRNLDIYKECLKEYQTGKINE